MEVRGARESDRVTRVGLTPQNLHVSDAAPWGYGPNELAPKASESKEISRYVRGGMFLVWERIAENV